MPISLWNLSRQQSEDARSAFYEGREFRIFKELNIPASGNYIMKVVVPVNIVVYGAFASVESGHLRLASVAGGTEGGSFTAMSRFAVNGMTVGAARKDYGGEGVGYSVQTAFSDGGTHTGGTELDLVRIKSANNTVQSITVGETSQDERGIPPGTYYFRMTNLSATDAIVGIFRFRWAELP